MNWGQGQVLGERKLKATEDCEGVQKKGAAKRDGPLFGYCPGAPAYPSARGRDTVSGFALGYGQPDESSQSCHTEGHASNNGHAH